MISESEILILTSVFFIPNAKYVAYLLSMFLSETVKSLPLYLFHN